jgi:hypothetical protein
VKRATCSPSLAGVFSVNPETKASTGVLQQFTVTADARRTARATRDSVIISPAIIAGGAFQNVTARPADNAAITFLGTANTAYPVSLGFVQGCVHLRDRRHGAPGGMDMAARANADGLSMRFVRGFDITNNRRISPLRHPRGLGC